MLFQSTLQFQCSLPSVLMYTASRKGRQEHYFKKQRYQVQWHVFVFTSYTLAFRMYCTNIYCIQYSNSNIISLPFSLSLMNLHLVYTVYRVRSCIHSYFILISASNLIRLGGCTQHWDAIASHGQRLETMVGP